MLNWYLHDFFPLIYEQLEVVWNGFGPDLNSTLVHHRKYYVIITQYNSTNKNKKISSFPCPNCLCKSNKWMNNLRSQVLSVKFKKKKKKARNLVLQ